MTTVQPGRTRAHYDGLHTITLRRHHGCHRSDPPASVASVFFLAELGDKTMFAEPAVKIGATVIFVVFGIYLIASGLT